MNPPSDHPDSATVPTADYARASDKPDVRGKGFLAVCATIFLPGLGHALAGRLGRGLKWLGMVFTVQVAILALLSVPQTTTVAFVAMPIAILTCFLPWIDAFRCARRSFRPMLRSAVGRYVVGAALLVAAVFVGPAYWASYGLAQFVRNRYVEAFVIASGSMSPTLNAGDRMLVHKKTDWGRWSVVVVTHPQYQSPNNAIRVVGLPGETVEIHDDELLIDGRPVQLPPGVGPYVPMRYGGPYGRSFDDKPGAGCEGNPITLGHDEYFVLGDNSMRALDARLWETPVGNHQLGALPKDNIKGRVTLIYWPPSRWRRLD